jgi:hypothetical protein
MNFAGWGGLWGIGIGVSIDEEYHGRWIRC